MSTPLGRRLRSLRRRAGLSATALAADELSVATISRIEHGTVEPSLATLRYLAARLGCAVTELLVEDEDRLMAALEEIEAWFLLQRPQAALDRALFALSAESEDVTRSVPALTSAAPLSRLRWAAVRAEALLEPTEASALDEHITAARRDGDVWALAGLARVRAATLDAEAALALLQVALRGLPPSAHDTFAQQVSRAELSLLLAQRFEAVGEIETARGLYSATATLCELFRQSVGLAERYLRPTESARPPLHHGPPVPREMAGRHREMSAGFALALLTAGLRCWRAATIDLARLDLQSRRLGEAARRLRGIYASSGDSAELAVLGGFWSELDRTLESGPGRQATAGRAFPQRAIPRDLDVHGEDDLLRMETAIHAGRPGEAEQIGALLAASLTTEAPALAHAIWLRLALAWAEAGHAPRAARALRAAGLPGQ